MVLLDAALRGAVISQKNEVVDDASMDLSVSSASLPRSSSVESLLRASLHAPSGTSSVQRCDGSQARKDAEEPRV